MIINGSVDPLGVYNVDELFIKIAEESAYSKTRRPIHKKGLEVSDTGEFYTVIKPVNIS